MEYMLMFYLSEQDQKDRHDPARKAAYHAGWMAYLSAIRESGHVKSGAGLQDAATATTVKVAAGKRRVQDGPFADTKEQIAGYEIIELADLDQAIEIASEHPTAARWAVEIRPFWEG